VRGRAQARCEAVPRKQRKITPLKQHGHAPQGLKKQVVAWFTQYPCASWCKHPASVHDASQHALQRPATKTCRKAPCSCWTPRRTQNPTDVLGPSGVTLITASPHRHPLRRCLLRCASRAAPSAPSYTARCAAAPGAAARRGILPGRVFTRAFHSAGRTRLSSPGFHARGHTCRASVR